MLEFERIIAFVAAIVTITGALAVYPFLLGRGSLRSCRHAIRKALARMKRDGFTPEVLISLGRGGFFVGALFTDEMGRAVPVIGIDKAYFEESSAGGKNRIPRVEVPESFSLPKEYTTSNLLMVTGEVVDGISARVAVDFVKRNVPRSTLKSFSLFWNSDSAFKPDYRGYEIRGRQRKLVWKRKTAPSTADYPNSRKSENKGNQPVG